MPKKNNNNIIKSVSVVRKTTTEKLSIRVLRTVDVVLLLRELSGYESCKILSESISGSFKIVMVEVENACVI